ncbi:hypothetical protein M9H77_30189 [Catharanthus roseus]|uniref:Uncharacterized protein n=1 Tax=Catharanthus roseus TaxID=4058 RepID=A0ACB9ZXW0_CATRO|nr:hypothetical protein M9H77_30189 [Catharanthus roseus]
MRSMFGGIVNAKIREWELNQSDLELNEEALRTKFGVENHGGQRQGQAKEKFMESLIERKIKRGKAKSVVSTKESERKRKGSEWLIENHESLKEEQVEEKEDEIEKSEETKENLISILELLNYNLWNKPNQGMKAKEEGVGKELSIGYDDTLISLSLNPFLLYHEFCFKELKLFLELYASYVTLVGNKMVNSFTRDLAFVVDYMLKCSSPCAYFEEQLLVSVARYIKLSHHDIELLYDNLLMFLCIYVEGFHERISWFSWSLSGVFHAKLKGEFIENCDYESSVLYASMETLDGFIPSIQHLCFVSLRFEFPHDEKRGYDMTVGMHEFLEDSSPGVKATRMVKMKINWNF